MRSVGDPRLLAFAALLLLGQPVTAGEDPPGTRLVTDGGVQVSESELDAMLGNRLVSVRTEEYQIRRRALEDHIAAVLLEREALARHLGVTQLTQLEIEQKVQPVTPEEVRAVYESAKERFGSQSEALARAQIEEGMLRQRIGKRRAEYVAELKAKAAVRVLLEPPRVSLSGVVGPSMGAETAPVTIVEYADFQCSYCSLVASTLKRLEEKHKGRVRLVFQDYPLPYHAQAPKASEAAHCAGEQGEFWKMHDSLFLNQKALDVADLKRLSDQLGLDAQQFSACLDSGRHEETWRKSMKAGESLGVKYTPTLFVNGRMISGAQPFEVFDEVVTDELRRSP